MARIDEKRFGRLLKALRRGEAVAPSALLAYLLQEQREQRLKVNYRVAEAYAESGRAGAAVPYARRAWQLSQFDDTLLPLFIKVHRMVGAVVAIQEAYKRAGMRKAKEGQIEQALDYFHLAAKDWRPNRTTYSNMDPDIYERIESLAAPYRFPPKPHRRVNGRVKIAYLWKAPPHRSQ